MIFLLLVVTATFRPAQPAVGDLIRVEFQKPVVLDQATTYEVVSHDGPVVVVRTFEPKPFALSGVVDGVRFRNLVVPVHSVLAPQDKQEPAPLRAPMPSPYPRAPLIAIAIAGGLAALAWTAVVVLARRRTTLAQAEILIAPADRFRATVAALRDKPSQGDRWAKLADATRIYLSAISPHLGIELTSAQLLARIEANHLALIAAILRQGDFEKFSPWGAPSADFDELAVRALDLIPVPQEAEAEAA